MSETTGRARAPQLLHYRPWQGTFRPPLFSVWPVIVEAYYVIDSRGGPADRVLHWLTARHLRLIDLRQAEILRMRQLRSELVERWKRQMACQGGLACSELGERPEQVCKQFVPQIQICLEWHTSTWQPLENQFQQLGFQWAAFLASTAPEAGDNAELRRIRSAVLGDLGQILQSRSGWLRHKRLLATLHACRPWPI